MKVFAEVLPRNLGLVMYRINKEMKKAAPTGTVFVTNPDEADIQILDIIGLGSLEFLYKKDNYVLLQHCYLTAERQDAAFWVPLFNKAKLVATYMNLQALTGSIDFNFLRMPWGVDGRIFKPIHNIKKFEIMATGHIADTECIDSAYEACRAVEGKLIHVGANFGWDPRYYVNASNISDLEMSSCYSLSRYTIGMRRGEGFELPILEGLASGSRGITLDTPQYRHWFGDLVEYVPEKNPEEITESLIKILTGTYRPVTEEERQFVVSEFSWKNIFSKFWERVYNACA